MKKFFFFEVNIQYPENLHNAQNDLPFLTRKKIENVEKSNGVAEIIHRNNHRVKKKNKKLF